MGASLSKKHIPPAHREALTAYSQHEMEHMKTDYSNCVGSVTGKVEGVHILLVRQPPRVSFTDTQS